MKEKIRMHVNMLFQDTPSTKRVYDLKEELIANLNAKFDDLVKEGKEEEQAYETTIAGIGDINELIETVKQENPMKQEMYEQRRKKSAFIVSVSIGLYILSIISIAITSELNTPDYMSLGAFLAIAGLATCLLVYYYMSRPKYIKEDDTIVEEFKEWKSNKNKSNEVISMINSILWLFIVAFYFIFTFLTSSWAYSWVIFLIGAAMSNIVRLYFKMKE